TILHSNDLHGDFMAKEVDKELLGGISMLSGYINKVRHEEENVLYTISGDMFRGSIIDSEYKGMSTIEIMNTLAPDVVTLGNHEIDYGLAHLLFIEKCAQFPIINANMYITTNGVRLFKSHIIKEIGGMKILFIGLLTESVLHSTKQEKIIGSFVDIHEAASEVGRICDSYRTEDIDFTVLLTHIGFEEDKKLASVLDPRWGVDIIIGGHSHTLLEKPEVVKGIPIVQAACGTNQIGRFDIIVDTDRNCIDHYDWRLIPIDDDYCPRDYDLEKVIEKYKTETDRKYKRIITRFADKYTHPSREQETTLGKLFADALKESLGVDIMMVGSGSIRGTELGPIVLLEDLIQIFPYNDEVFRIAVTGSQLRTMIKHILRTGALLGVTEFYQYSKGFHIVFDYDAQQLLELSLDGKDIEDEKLYTIGINGFHYKNLNEFMGVKPEEVAKNKEPKVIATKCTDVVEEYFSRQEYIKVSDEKSLVIKQSMAKKS
ncbi:MAG: bifunctional metallophosphatase/5'-nucleotidase, partial [Oscillospiraceae bacterium]|nr:bifunctional metallophosphatase/5'-nucleotidase [Oscillospiraceae bacterium]